MQPRLRVGVYGGSGYVGLELIRLLLNHPQTQLSLVTSREHQGKKVSDLHRSLLGLLDLEFSGPDQEFRDLDVLFLAVPHAQSAPVVGRLMQSAWFRESSLKLIDLGADFRLSAPYFKKFYDSDHPCPTLITEAVYGTPELAAAQIREARLVANPGCFANCTILALAPLARYFSSKGWTNFIAHTSAITGSSGSGATATQKTHHPERNESLNAYEVLTHRHIPEIERALALSASNVSPAVRLVPHSGPFSRGIFATSFVTLPEQVEVLPLYEAFCGNKPFLRLRKNSPRLVDVRGSNFCDLAVFQRGTEVVITSTLDNLVKGAAGNAIQNMNIMHEWDERLGLAYSALVP